MRIPSIDFFYSVLKDGICINPLIKSFRKNFHITQAELCHATGISEKYLSGVENGKPLNKL